MSTSKIAKFATELLVTDTLSWEVIRRTPNTLKLRMMRQGEVISRSEGDYPIVYTEALPDENGQEVTVWLRADGTYRIANGRPLWFTDQPTFKTDYSF
jgi:hypothetical protein